MFTLNIFSCNINYFLFSTQNCFLCNTNLLLWTLFSILTIATKIKKYNHVSKIISKSLFLCKIPKLISSFVYHILFTFNFYIGSRNKKLFNLFFSIYAPAWNTEAITKGCPRNKLFLIVSFSLCETSAKGLYFSKFTGLFPANFSEMNFKQFPIVSNIFRRLSNVGFRKF